MTAKTIMTADPVVVLPTDKVSTALLLMHKHSIHELPVVDEEGAFVGLFGRIRFIEALLPLVTQGRHGLSDLSFLPDSEAKLIKHLEAVGEQPVSDFLEKKKNLTFCKPGTPFPKLLQLLSQSKTTLPVIVVKGKDKKVVGMVSTWDLLSKIAMSVFFAQEPEDTQDSPESDGEQEDQDAR